MLKKQLTAEDIFSPGITCISRTDEWDSLPYLISSECIIYYTALFIPSDNYINYGSFLSNW